MMSGRANACHVAVVGAGPYGLSVAAHLMHAGISARVFGEPMAFWRHNMPKGMKLRSPWRATHISGPGGSLSLDAYAAAHGLDSSKLLPVEDFVSYGEWFQKRAVPDVDRRAVRLIEATTDGFRLTLADGELFGADHVVIATGLLNQEYRPLQFRHLPAALASHTSEHADLSLFRGKRVAVIGRGQSACESAALLDEAGAEAELVSRGEIHWLGSNRGGRRALRRLRAALASPSEVGPFPLSWLVELPNLVRHLPIGLRDGFAQKCLMPGAAGWLKPRFAGVKCIPGYAVTAARAQGNRVVLHFDQGARTFDHVLLGTGYRVDIARLGILAAGLRERVVCADGSPVLGAGFESSVPRLHFVGSYAVKSFGPLLRFIAGAPYAARMVAAAVRRQAPRRPVESPRRAAASFAAVPGLSPPQ